MIRDEGRMVDGITSLHDGMDSGRSPSMINPSQTPYAENITMRGGFAKTRPGFNRVTFDDTSTTTEMLEARFQGAMFYNESDTVQHTIVVAGGKVYKTTPGSAIDDDWTVVDITNSVTVSSSVQRVHMIQAEKYLIIQDGTNAPFLWSHDTSVLASARASVPGSDEVPIGSGPMAYGNGRLWVAKGTEFVASDIHGGDSTIIKFTENTYISGGGAFRVPSGTGGITALQFLTRINSALGTGEMMAYTSDGAFTICLPLNRYDWADFTDPIQKVALPDNGAMSQFSTVGVNNDQFIRSRDGVRSLKDAVRAFGDPGNTLMSREINRILKHDDQSYLAQSSAVLFDNRLLFTAVTDYDGTSGIGFKGLAVLDFDIVSGLRGNAPAVWEGFWRMKITRSETETDFDILQIYKGRYSNAERAFVAVRNEDNELEFWELKRESDNLYYDTDGATEHRITSELETPSFNFEAIGSAKELESADMWVDKVAGQVDFTIEFRPDQYPCWQDWQTWTENAAADSADQYRPRMRIGRPLDTAEAAVGNRINYGWEFQSRLKWTGHARLKLFRMNARAVQEEPYDDVVNQDSSSYTITCAAGTGGTLE